MEHQLNSRLVAEEVNSPSKDLVGWQVNRIALESNQYNMHQSEKKFCKIKLGRIPFSLESLVRIRRWL